MATITLTMALDFRKRKGVPREKIFFRRGEQWFMVARGPTYENHFKLSDLSADELAYLEQWERDHCTEDKT